MEVCPHGRTRCTTLCAASCVGPVTGAPAVGGAHGPWQPDHPAPGLCHQRHLPWDLPVRLRERLPARLGRAKCLVHGCCLLGEHVESGGEPGVWVDSAVKQVCDRRVVRGRCVVQARWAMQQAVALWVSAVERIVVAGVVTVEASAVPSPLARASTPPSLHPFDRRHTRRFWMRTDGCTLCTPAGSLGAWHAPFIGEVCGKA